MKQSQSQANEKETLPANAVRQQEMLLPVHVEDYVSQHNGVRAIDAYVNTLDLSVLGFKNTQSVLGAGQPNLLTIQKHC
jgi:type IV secretory pathway VirD2 relaxase